MNEGQKHSHWGALVCKECGGWKDSGSCICDITTAVDQPNQAE